ALAWIRVGGKRWRPFIVPSCPAILDGRVLTVDVAGFLETLAERGHVRRIPVGRCAIEDPDPRHRRLLRARRKRPRGRRTAEKADELASSHVEHAASLPAIRWPGS